MLQVAPGCSHWNQQETVQAVQVHQNLFIDDSGNTESHRCNGIWKKKFKDPKDIEQLLRDEACWSKAKIESLQKGLKTVYRCKMVKKRGHQCSQSVEFPLDLPQPQWLMW